jgi:hypothetical protein
VLRQARDQDLVDVHAHSELILRARHHDDRSEAAGVGVIGPCRRDIAPDRRIHRQHDAVDRSLDHVLREQRAAGLTSLHQRFVLRRLAVDVVAPGTRARQLELPLSEVHAGLRRADGVLGVVERALAHGAGIELVGLSNLVVLILCSLQVRARDRELRDEHVEVFAAGEGFEPVQGGLGGFGLQPLLFVLRARHRVVDREQHGAGGHAVAFVRQDLHDRSRDLGVDVDVRAARLRALDDAVGEDAARERVRGRRVDRRHRLLLDAEVMSADDPRHDAHRGGDEDRCVLHDAPLSNPVMAPSSMCMIRSANS